MLGQSFFPGGDDEQLRRQQAGGGQVNPVQEAIKVLSLKLPRVLGAAAPAPMQLMSGLGGAAVNNPLSQMILQQFAPQMGAGGGAPSGGMPPPPSSGKPKVEFMPGPGGTAGPGPGGRRPGPFSDLPEPPQVGGRGRVRSV